MELTIDTIILAVSPKNKSDVYSIQCECWLSYVGETYRKVSFRVK